ncbi:MAG: RluA family pseudouridine synthase [Burkholderiales bacterium]|nr:RluA family pseudouridine synthase [Burkholderiales bacterium]
MATRKKSSRSGSAWFGLVLGMVLGVAAAVAVALFVTKAPMPFKDKASRDAPTTLLPDVKNAPDPNIALYGKDGPAGTRSAAQGGSGTKRHMDGLLKSLPNKQGEAPRLVHRLDRDTSGVLVVAKTRAAASHFGKVFQSHAAQKIYWAVVYGVPKPAQGSISCFLAKQIVGDNEQMVVVEQNYPGAQHSKTYYSITDSAARRFSWVTLKPVTGRTHQLRVHMAQLGNPIMGDPRYFNIENFQGAPGLGEGLHLHARRIRLPLRSGKLLDVSAPLPPHMVQSFEALGFDADRYDVKDQDPERE